jgi:hypothetical protein
MTEKMNVSRPSAGVITVVLVLTVAPLAAAQPAADGSARAPAEAAAPMVVDGAPPPVPPAVITRAPDGRVTVRATRIDSAPRIDGTLDDEAYTVIEPANGFIQQEPYEGEPATEKTDVWIMFDDENVYVGGLCWDSQPDRWVTTEMRRDHNNITQNENVSVVFDTFHDKRNGFFFQTTPLGAIRDQIFTDEGNQNTSWNTIWSVRTARFDGGWSFEMAIPFKSLRYRGAGPQVWGFQVRRMARWKNEESYLTPVSAAWGNFAIFRASAASTLVGIETPAQSVNLEVKPYLASTTTTDLAASEPFTNRWSRGAGFDFKYGLTRSLIADVTVNTDFAQVEEDVQQVNLTRFSLFFPEKREFFLEGQGTFAFGVPVGTPAFAAAGGGDTPTLFFSRRIGLSEGQSVPIIVGGRVNGTAGLYNIGILNIQTDEKADAGAVKTNFTVLRVKRSILRRSNVGLLFTNRSPTAAGTDSNLAIGAEANFAFFRSVTFSTYYARTSSGDRADDGDASSYRARFEYSSDRHGLIGEHLLVGDAFNPEVGFVRRSDFRRSAVTARFSPRPAGSRLVRRHVWQGGYDYVTDGRATRVENRGATGLWRVEFANSDMWSVDYARDYEFLPEDFEIATGVVVPIGGYTYQTLSSTYVMGQQRRVSGRLTVRTGTFYEGTRQEMTLTAGRMALSTRLNIEPGLTLNWVDLPQGRFNTELFTARVIFTPSPRSLVSGLFQLNPVDETLSSSVRLRWEYTGGSEIFVVYTDNRNTQAGAASTLMNRSFAVKITRLVRF